MATIRNYNLNNMLNNTMSSAASLDCVSEYQPGCFEHDILGKLCSCVDRKRFKS